MYEYKIKLCGMHLVVLWIKISAQPNECLYLRMCRRFHVGMFLCTELLSCFGAATKKKKHNKDEQNHK